MKRARDSILNAPDLPVGSSNGHSQPSSPIPKRRGAITPELIDALDAWGVLPEPDHLHDPEPVFDSVDPAYSLASINPAFLDATPYSPDEPWGMMEGESDLDYQRFSHYRALGLARTKTEVARHFKVHNNKIYQTARENDWDNRARAWDVYKEEQYTAELLEKTREMAGVHANIAAKGVKALASIFDVLLQRIDSDSEEFLDSMNKWPTHVLLKLAQDSAKALPNLMSAERLSRGLPTSLTATVSKTDMRITVHSSDELAEILSTLNIAQPTVIDGRVVEEDLDDDGDREGAA